MEARGRKILSDPIILLNLCQLYKKLKKKRKRTEKIDQYRKNREEKN